MILRKKLSAAILLATFANTSTAFEFHLEKSFNDHPNEDEQSLDFLLFDIKAADLNNDGFMDLLVSDFGPKLELSSSRPNGKEGLQTVWFNNGQGEFEESAKTSNHFAVPFTLVDIDNDDDLDMVSMVSTYLNDGQGHFISPGYDGEIVSLYNWALNDKTNYTAPIAMVDLNNNQKLDVVGIPFDGVFLENYFLNDYGDVYSNNIVIGINDPSAKFFSLVEASDNNPDAEHFTAYIEENSPVKYAFHDSSLSVSTESILTLGQSLTAFVDVDNDGDLDVWVNSSKLNDPALSLQFSLHINDGAGNFSPSEQTSFFNNLQIIDDNLITASTKIATGDIDGDGDQDVWISTLSNINPQGVKPYILINDGTGKFTELVQNSTENVFNSFDVQLVDIDNDGDLDALEVSIVINEEQSAITSKLLKIWLNDGTGQFTDSHKDITGFYGAKVTTADLNNDGLKDIIVGNQVYFNGVAKRNSRLCDWAEKRFPRLFPRVKKVLNLIFGDWEYRYYPSVDTYLGVNTKEKKVYVLGDSVGGLKVFGSPDKYVQ